MQEVKIYPVISGAYNKEIVLKFIFETLTVERTADILKTSKTKFLYKKLSKLTYQDK